MGEKACGDTNLILNLKYKAAHRRHISGDVYNVKHFIMCMRQPALQTHNQQKQVQINSTLENCKNTGIVKKMMKIGR